MAEPSRRILSMDQFRGYTIVGMFVVNFLSGLPGIHPTFAHHNTHFSYADSIMPSFFFAVGFSLRLSVLRRLASQAAAAVYGRALYRCLMLVFVSLLLNAAMETDDYRVDHWSKITPQFAREFGATLLKSGLWETLALIGATSALILPVIARAPFVRICALVGCAVAHVGLSYWFNYAFVHGMPNWLDPYWGAKPGTRSFDGGPFGILSWAIPALAGSLAYDVVVNGSVAASFRRLFGWGTALMLLGYSLSCLTTLYNVESLSSEAIGKDQHGAFPIIPRGVSFSGRSAESFLAEPPFVPPPAKSVRLENYWMMSKRTMSISFSLFAAGFAMALYSLFVVVCDGLGGQAGVLATFGANPLAAYIIHEIVKQAIKEPFVPKDASVLWSLDMFAVFFAITYLFVRALEKQGIYIRL